MMNRKYFYLPEITAIDVENSWVGDATGGARKRALYQFHHWLAVYKKRAARKERDRIIKLLEESDIGRCCFESHDLIALIKEEN